MIRTLVGMSRLAVGALTLGALVGVMCDAVAAQTAGPATQYDQGDPTSEEQYLLEQLNRARMDPAGEGQRLAAWLRANPAVVSQYGVNPDQVASDFAALPAVPPLAFNRSLLASASTHSADLAAHNGNSPGGDDHSGYDGSTAISRVEAAGFLDSYAGENVYTGGTSLDEIHAAFLVDWGVADLGHRQQAMDGSNAINVVGVGVASVPNRTFVETEDYGMPGLAVSGGKLTNADVPAMLTGVVYNDANGNGQYDPGEGIAGVTVSMDGGMYYAVTGASGGYSFPMVNADGSNANGAVPVRMTFADGGTFTAVASIVPFATRFGAYRGNVEWDGLGSDDSASPPNPISTPAPTPDPDMPYFAWVEGGATVSAGETAKVKVFRPASSDVSEPYTFGYKTKGTAVAGVDYLALPMVATIPAGATMVKIKVHVPSNVDSISTLKLKLPGVTTRGAMNVKIVP